MRLEYSNHDPVKAGFYFFRWNKDKNIYVVRMFFSEGYACFAFPDKSLKIKTIKDLAQWAGPIQEPV